MIAPWFNLAMLAFESQQVVALRLMKLAGGGSVAMAEIRLMVDEKMAAGRQAGERLLAGSSPDAVVSRYRRIVRANVRRLSR